MGIDASCQLQLADATALTDRLSFWTGRAGEIRLVLRHPRKSPIRSVRVDGKEWKDFDPTREFVSLKPVGRGRLSVVIEY